MITNPLFLTDTFAFATLINIVDIGIDEKGYFFVSDSSIFYPQGGGQPSDTGFISIGETEKYTIIAARYAEDGAIKHYVENPMPQELMHKEVAMRIIQDSRRMNAAYHTAGHWLSQIVFENLELPLTPAKGHHFPGEAYIEFEGDIKTITEEMFCHIQMAMRVDLQADLKITAENASIDSSIFCSAFLPKNFTPPTNKPLRFVTIENYKPIPCGGTHLPSLRDLKSVTPTSFYAKGRKVRLTYNCSPWLCEAD